MPLCSCLGARRPAAAARAGDGEPLLAHHHDHADTLRQQRLQRKLHSYQMAMALSKGFMPSTEQLVLQLRSLLASDPLNPADATLSDSGRLLAKHSRALIAQLIDLLLDKNRGDALQDFVWCLTKSHLAQHPPDPSWRAVAAARSDASATTKSLQTLSSLLLTNSDFRLFLSDLQTVGRQVFRDVAFSASSAVDTVAREADPSNGQPDLSALRAADAQDPPSSDDLTLDADHLKDTLNRAGKDVTATARQSAQDHLTGAEKDTLLQRLQAAAIKLRQRPDYNESVSTIAIIARHYALTYVSAAETAVDAAKGRVQADPHIDIAISSLSSLLTSFGNPDDWQELKSRWEKCLLHFQNDPNFEQTVDKCTFALQKMFTDPAIMSQKSTDLSELRRAFLEDRNKSGSIEADIDSLLTQLQRVWLSVLNDDHLLRLSSTASRIFSIISPSASAFNGELTKDMINVMLPLLVQAIQHVPIPRLEVATPEIDLLLENLILEPGKTVNSSSFLPFRFRVETYNDLEILKARFGTVSRATSLATVKIEGLSLRADDIGFWLRTHAGLFRFADEGIASFELDERGVDIHLDVEIGKEHLENVLSLRAVRVRVHKLSYTLRQSKFACLAWVLKPFLGFVIRKTLERQLASAIADFFHAANREIIFMRERLRATRVAQPQDIATFFKAVLARLTPDDDPDVYLRVGVAQPGRGVFRGVYAPGSVVKTWVEEGMRASEVVEDYQRSGWRNDIFDALPPPG